MDKQVGGKIYHIIRFQQFPPPQRQQIQHTHRQALTNIQPATTNTNLPQRPQQAQQGQGNNSRDYNALLRNRPCWVCDRTGHLIRECPKKKPKGCPRCGQDHSIFHCPNRKQTVRYITVEEVQEEGSGTQGNTQEILARDQQDGFMEQHDSRVVMAVRDNLKKLILKYDIKVGQEDVRAIVDTGAQVSLMSRKVAQKLKITMNQHHGGVIKGVNGNALTIDGKACVRIKTSISCKPTIVFVTPDIEEPLILGLPWILDVRSSYRW